MKNREIKFRGLSLKGEWIYGTVHTYGDGVFICQKELMNNAGRDWRIPAIEVRPESVGQLTGLKDKNGKEIYEGDLLKVRDPYNECWSINGGEVIFSYEYVGGWVLTSNKKDKLNIGTRTNHVEIIGNIYENPELLK